jgi:uncharacterized phage protein gp47/JayE
VVAGLTADGFVAKTFDDIEQGFIVRQRADIDTNIDTTRFELVGQLNGIMASAIAELWELALELHDSLDPDAAVGWAQDSLYSLTGTQRRDRKRSTVVARVKLQPGTDIAVGDATASVLGNSVVKFTNAQPMVNVGVAAAYFDVTFEAVDYGPTIANAGMLQVIDTPLVGWDEVNNLTDAQPGTLVESNAAYRVRRVEELASQGGGTTPGIRADLLKIATVRAVIVVENTTLATVDGVPPKSFEVIVRSDDIGGLDDAAIAASIWSNKPAGIEAFGTEDPVAVTDSEGVVHAIRFSRPTERAIYVALRLLTGTAYVGHVAAKQAIVDATESSAAVGYLDVGADVYAGRLVAAAMALPGVVNADARLSFAPIVDFTAAPVALVIGSREIAAVDTSRISIGAFPP